MRASQGLSRTTLGLVLSSLLITSGGALFIPHASAQTTAPEGDRSEGLQASASVLGTRTSPFEPPPNEDIVFVVDDSSGLDTGCTFRSEGPLRFNIAIDRFIGAVDGNGHLVDADKLIAEGLISATAELVFPAFDVDNLATVPPPFRPEIDIISLNGVELGTLSGLNNTWTLENKFLVDINDLRFPADPDDGGVLQPALNEIRVDIDTGNAPLDEELWCTSIDWAALKIEAARPILLVHGILSSGATWAAGPWDTELAGLPLPHDTIDLGNLGNIQGNAAQIATRVESLKRRWGIQKLNVVAHSKGGIDSREFSLSSDALGSLMQIGTPNGGSPLANYVLGIGSLLLPIPTAVLNLLGPAARQLTTQYMTAYNLTHGRNQNTQYYAIAGEHDSTALVGTLLNLILPGPDDEIVPASSVYSLSFINALGPVQTSGEFGQGRHVEQTQGPSYYNLYRGRVGERAVPNSIAGPPAPEPAAMLTRSFAVSVSSGETRSASIQLEPGHTGYISMMYGLGNIDMTIVSPSGIRYDGHEGGLPLSVSFASSESMDALKMEVYEIENPEGGQWTGEVRGATMAGSSGTESVLVSGWTVAPSVTLTAQFNRTFYRAGASAIISAELLSGGLPLTGASAIAHVGFPDRTFTALTLVDDGSGGDSVPEDGVYSAAFMPPPAPGLLRAVVDAAGPLGQPVVREAIALATVSRSSTALSGSFSEENRDTDSNGLANELVIHVGLSVDVAGRYRVHGVLVDEAGNRITEGTFEGALNPGAVNVDLIFDGREIFTSGADGIYGLGSISLAEVADPDILILDQAAGAFQTHSHLHTEYEHGAIVFTRRGTDVGVDLDGNGRFDRLDVGVEVDLSFSGFYQWSARLESVLGQVIAVAAGQGSQTQGRRLLSLSFNGRTIGESGIDGPFIVTGFTIFGGGRSAIGTSVYQTSSYTSGQFEGGRQNAPPISNAGPDQTVECTSSDGAASAVDGGASSDPDGDRFSCRWSSATCSFGDPTACATSATCPLGSNTLSLIVNDGILDSVPDEALVSVRDTTPPVITGTSSDPPVLWPPNHVMRDITIGYTATDICSPTICSLAVTSNEPDNGTGDGDTAPDWTVLDDHHLQLRAERAGTGNGRTYTPSIRCADTTGNASGASTAVLVKHDMSSPKSGAAFRIGSSVSFAGSFWDVPGRTHTAQWLFDSLTHTGTVTDPTATKPGSVTGGYTFTSTGVYAVKMNVKDTSGATGTADAVAGVNALVVIYDPNGGYVTGGGWLDSPPGAYKANAGLTGKVNFGFVSKYFKNATNPKGETEFGFRLANFKFNAVNLDYLMISGAKAQYKGFGKVNGDGGYGFILTVIDGQASGGGGVDKFRIKIWNKTSSAIVYDNQMGAPDNADPAAPVGAGSSIVIQP